MDKPQETALLLKQGIWLEYITLFWNVLGTIILVIKGYQAHSIALFGFGMDSCIEIFASLIVVWQLKSIHQKHEPIARRLIGIAFLLLALYILSQSLHSLWIGIHPKPSLFGVLWLLSTVILMLLLAKGKRRIGNQLNHAVLLSEAKITVIDGYLAAIILAGLLVNAVWGYYWADPIGALLIVPWLVKEGISEARS